MDFPIIEIEKEDALEVNDFIKLEEIAVEKYKLPKKLMMENAGYQLARVIALHADKSDNITIGVGTGNNGGGGLVAARRLLAWGFNISLLIMDKIAQKLPQKQLERAYTFGAELTPSIKTNVFVDAFFGFSQRLPLPDHYIDTIKNINKTDCTRISLDLPSGISEGLNQPYFDADVICTLAAPKKILYHENLDAKILIADMGIPNELYKKMGHNLEFPFYKSSILELQRS